MNPGAESWKSSLWMLKVSEFILKFRAVSLEEPTGSGRAWFTARGAYVMIFRTTVALLLALNMWLGVASIRLANANRLWHVGPHFTAPLVSLVVVAVIQLHYLLNQRLFGSTMKQADQFCSDFIESESVNVIRRRSSIAAIVVGLATLLLFAENFSFLTFTSSSFMVLDDEKVSPNKTLVVCTVDNFDGFCFDVKTVYIFVCWSEWAQRMFTVCDGLCLFTGCEILMHCFEDMRGKILSSTTCSSTYEKSLSSTSQSLNESVALFLTYHRKCAVIVANFNILFQRQVSLLTALLIMNIIINTRSLNFMADDFMQHVTDIDIRLLAQYIVFNTTLTAAIIKCMAGVNNALIGSVTSVVDAQYVSFVGERTLKTSKLVDEELILYMESLSSEPPGLELVGCGIVDNGFILDIGFTIVSFCCIVYGL